MAQERLRLAQVRHTSVFRLTAALGAVLVVAVVTVQGLTYALTARELTTRSDSVLYREAARLIANPAERQPAAIAAMAANSTSGLNFYALVAANGQPIAGNIALPAAPAGGGPFDVPAGQLKPVPLRVLVLGLGNGQKLLLARDVTPISDLRQRMLIITLYSGLAVVLAAGLVGVGLSRGPLRRIQQAQAIALRIARGELGLRMPRGQRGDELDLVAGMINAMLGEIERLMQQVKGTTDAIAHDLRRPLAHVRHKLARVANEADHQAIGAAIEDIDQVLARFNALLRISEIEASQREQRFAPIEPMTLLAGLAELYEPLAEERAITLTVHGSYGQLISGDEGLLIEALSNLVDNALKYVPEGGQVQLAVHTQGETVELGVCDNGPGIPEAERALVLERFRRGAAADCANGSGLGLHLVAAIARLHGFALALQEADPGLHVVIRAPRLRG